MKLSDIRIDVLRKVVDSLPDTFRTRDASEHELMMAAHIVEKAYHSLVGKRLRRMPDLVRLIGPASGGRGVLWLKVAATGSDA